MQQETKTPDFFLFCLSDLPLNDCDGFTLVSPVHTRQVQTLLQGVHIREDFDKLPVAVKRQTTAFPPNFVHSLDSTHMMMTAIEMDKVGVPFAAVHDSYWVHAGNVDTMNDKLRQVPVVDGWLCVSGVLG